MPTSSGEYAEPTTDVVTVYTDEAGEYRWRRTAANGEPVSVSGEGYVNKGHAVYMAESRNPGIPVKHPAEEGDDGEG